MFSALQADNFILWHINSQPVIRLAILTIPFIISHLFRLIALIMQIEMQFQTNHNQKTNKQTKNEWRKKEKKIFLK